MSDTNFYSFEAIDMSGLTPYGKTTEWEMAAWLFSTPAKATAYAQSKGHGTDWKVRELTALDCLDWLYDAKDLTQVSAVWFDPDPSEEGYRELPIDVMISVVSKASGLG